MTKSRRGPRCNAASRYWPITRVIVKSATPNARTRLARRNLPRVDCRVVSTREPASGCPPSKPSGKVPDTHSVGSICDHDFGVFTVTNIATENTDAVPPAHPVPRKPKPANQGWQRCRGPRVSLTCLAPLAAWQSLCTGHVDASLENFVAGLHRREPPERRYLLLPSERSPHENGYKATAGMIARSGKHLFPLREFRLKLVEVGEDAGMARTLQAAALPRIEARQVPAAAPPTALGIVYGDIGTSALYGFKQAADAAGATSPETIMGIVSVILWSLIVIVSFKYAILIMRADNRGER